MKLWTDDMVSVYEAFNNKSYNLPIYNNWMFEIKGLVLIWKKDNLCIQTTLYDEIPNGVEEDTGLSEYVEEKMRIVLTDDDNHYDELCVSFPIFYDEKEFVEAYFEVMKNIIYLIENISVRQNKFCYTHVN